jgi:hypothetical protein
LCRKNWRICGTMSEIFPITGKNKFYFTHTWENSFPPTWKPSTLHCLLRCKSNSMCKSSGRCKVVLHLRLNSLLYWTSYPAAFNSVQSYYTAFMLCTEFHTECLTLYQMFYTATGFCRELLTLNARMYRIPYTIFTSVKWLLGCIHLRTELFTTPSLYRMPYSYSHIWMLITQMLLTGMCKELNFSPNTWGAG